jgi:hypothetical protein
MKAELFSSDFVISILIFLCAIVIINFYYQNLQSDVYESSVRNEMFSKAVNIASLLATTSGYPKYWNNTSVKVIGLYDDGKFNLTKFEELKKINFNTARTMLGTGPYKIYIALKNETDDIIENQGTLYSYGFTPTNAEQTVLVKRLGMVKIEETSIKTTMEVILWL